MRRLAAILAADIVGFTALMAQNEQAALNRIMPFAAVISTRTSDSMVVGW
ncbi:hypothetical protein [Falsiphaeobacter marinintestinus]|nr:hypothetical protein [Phaeobacter marinintestinus]